MLHIYYGDGKGKTTAAMGLALRALGHEKHVTILQFLKDGSSGEIAMLRRCEADVHVCPNAKFTWLMTDAEKTEARAHNNAALRKALAALDLIWRLAEVEQPYTYVAVVIRVGVVVAFYPALRIGQHHGLLAHGRAHVD